MPLTPQEQEQERLHYIHGGAEAELWGLMCDTLAQLKAETNESKYVSTREDDLEGEVAALDEEVGELRDRINFLECELHDAEIELAALRS